MKIPKMDDEPDRERADHVINISREKHGIPRILRPETKPSDKPYDKDDPLAGIEPDEVF